MKNFILRYTVIFIILGVFITTVAAAFASNGITPKPCPSKPKKVFSGTAAIGEERKSSYPFTIQQGTFELLRQYIKGACEMNVIMSSDLEDMSYVCKQASVQTGQYSGFSCHPGGAEKERAIDASMGDWLQNPVIFIGPGYQNNMEINFEAQREDGTNAGYVPGVVDGVTDADINVSVFASH